MTPLIDVPNPSRETAQEKRMRADPHRQVIGR
jgi:hypothetical protein